MWSLVGVVMSDVRYLSSFNLLLLSPDEDLRREIAGFLGPFGYRVTSMSDGMEGLERIRTDPPDLVISDVALVPSATISVRGPEGTLILVR